MGRLWPASRGRFNGRECLDDANLEQAAQEARAEAERAAERTRWAR